MNVLPDNVRALVTGRVNSIEKLVIIVELGMREGHQMPVTELMKVLTWDATVFREALRELSDAKLVAEDGGMIQLVSSDQDLLDLLRVYDEDPAGTFAALSTIAMNRIRSMAHAFADAFDIRKKR